MARWARLQLANGTFEGRRLVSQGNLAYTRTPKVAITDKASYALGWAVAQTPNGSIVAHDGGTAGFGAQIGLLLDRDVAVIVLSNTENMGLPGAITVWTLDRLLDNPAVDHVAEALKQAKSKFAAAEKLFVKPEAPRPFPALAPLAGDFVSPALGKAVLRVQSDALVLELQATGAELALKPWDGDVFTFRQLPHGRFADAVEGTAERPYGLAQFALDAHGKLGLLRLSFDDGQAYEFRRE
jgi:hypothetical protein